MLQGSWWYSAEPITIFDINRTRDDYRKKRDYEEEPRRVPGGGVRYGIQKVLYVHKAKKISLMSEIVDPVLSSVT